MPGETNLSPITAQVYNEGAGTATPEVKNATMTPTDRLRVDIAGAPGAPIPVYGEKEKVVWAVGGATVVAGTSYPVDPDDGRFNIGVAIAGMESLLGSVKEFTIHAAIRTTGSGLIIIEYMTSAVGAWIELDRLSLAVAQVIVKRYVATANRYRVYFLADVGPIDTTDFDGNVYLKPQT